MACLPRSCCKSSLLLLTYNNPCTALLRQTRHSTIIQTFTTLRSQPCKSSPQNKLKRTKLFQRSYETDGNRDYNSGNRSSLYSYIPYALVAIAAGAVVWGLGRIHDTMTMWPKVLREDLRTAIRAKHDGDLKLSQKYYKRAWETVQQLPLDMLAPDAYRKITGIGIEYSAILEKDNKIQQAYEVLRNTLKILVPKVQEHTPFSSPEDFEQSFPLDMLYTGGNAEYNVVRHPTAQFSSSDPSLHVRTRAVEIALKLGEMASYLNLDREEEQWFVFAAREVIQLERDEVPGVPRTLLLIPGNSSNPLMLAPQSDGPKDGQKSPRLVFMQGDAQEEVPTILLSAPLERLGDYYARRGSNRIAVSLFVAAFRALFRVPLTPETTDVDTMCRGLQIANQLIAAKVNDFIEAPHSATDIVIGSIAMGTAVYTTAQHLYEKNHRGDMSLCHLVMPAIYDTAGFFYEFNDQLPQAEAYYAAASAMLNRQGRTEYYRKVQAALQGTRRKIKETQEAQSRQSPNVQETNSEISDRSTSGDQ